MMTRFGYMTVRLILIIIGGMFLLRSMDILFFNIPHIIFSGAFITFLVGILILVNSRKKILGGIITAIGFLWLLPRITPSIDIDSGIILSAAIIGLGIYIIFKHRGSPEIGKSQSSGPGSASYSYSSDPNAIKKAYKFGFGLYLFGLPGTL